MTRENIEDAFQDGVKLLELRFAPAFIAVTAGRQLLTSPGCSTCFGLHESGTEYARRAARK